MVATAEVDLRLHRSRDEWSTGTYQLTGKQATLRSTVRELAEAKIAPAAADVDATARYPQEALDALTAARLHAAHVPEEYGGEGANALAAVIIIEEVARACASAALIPAVNKLGTVPLLLAGSKEQRRKYLPPVARGEAMISSALSEAGTDSDAASMRTHAIRDGDWWVLNGSKAWISNAGVSQFYTVMAVTEPGKGSAGISAFVVEKSDPGVSFGKLREKFGARGLPARPLIFANARIPADRIIGDEGAGFKAALVTLDHARIAIAAQALGIAQGALDCTVGYARQRELSGRLAGDFQGAELVLADMAMKLEGARRLTYHAAVLSERTMTGERVPELTFTASAAKCFATDTAMAVTTDAVQLLGDHVRGDQVRMMRDAKAAQISEGTNQIQRGVMARELFGGNE
jgi:alkylation response protein AidB-like acyl-CoA dehydrogenase